MNFLRLPPTQYCLSDFGCEAKCPRTNGPGGVYRYHSHIVVSGIDLYSYWQEKIEQLGGHLEPKILHLDSPSRQVCLQETTIVIALGLVVGCAVLRFYNYYVIEQYLLKLVIAIALVLLAGSLVLRSKTQRLQKSGYLCRRCGNALRFRLRVAG